MVVAQKILMISRIREALKSGETSVSGDQWPTFLYDGYVYDPKDPWNGLLRSQILVRVSQSFVFVVYLTNNSTTGFQAHLHLPQLS